MNWAATLELGEGLRSVVESRSMRTLEVRLEDARDGSARGSWFPPAAFLNGNGVVQGGFVGAVVDQIMAAAIASMVGTQKFASINLQTTFHRALTQETYEVVARVARLGKRVAYLTAEITRDGDIFASCQSSVMLQGGASDPRISD